MTEKLKSAIREYRLQGIGYGRIAFALGLKETAVRAYCKSHGLSGDVSLVKRNYAIWCELNNCCPVCGTVLPQNNHGRRRKFCSGRCRVRYCREKGLYE